MTSSDAARAASTRGSADSIAWPGASRNPDKPRSSGNLRIGDHWNAITIIALSQSNPLKAVAELVENSIDARAKTIVITRGKEKGQHYLRVKDDGEGVRRNADGEPDFHYVATHVCDSIKRQLKVQGAGGLQGEFGIGLLSFWTLGEELLLTSASEDGRAFQMHLKKGDPSYRITHRPTLFAEAGTEVLIRGILPGIKNFSGDKIQWYLASELRDRIRHSGVSIRVVDRTARAEYKVEPRQFEGRLLHELDGACLPRARCMRSCTCTPIRRPTRCRSIVRARACSAIWRNSKRSRACPGRAATCRGSSMRPIST